MPKCFSASNAVLNKSVPMNFRHEKTWNTMERDWWNIAFPKSPKAVLFESLGKVPQKGIIAEKP